MNQLLNRPAYTTYPVIKPMVEYHGIPQPKGNYRKMLAVCYGQCDGSKPQVVGYIAWRKSDNHKMLFVRDGNSLTLGANMPQTRKTDMHWLASQFGVPVARLSLRNKTGLTGPRRPIVGQPVFNSSSVAGGWNLV